MDPQPTQSMVFMQWASFATHIALVVAMVKLLWEVRRVHHRLTIVWNWFKKEHGIDDSED